MWRTHQSQILGEAHRLKIKQGRKDVLNSYCSLPYHQQEDKDAPQLPSGTCLQNPAQPSDRFISPAKLLRFAWISLPCVTVWKVAAATRELTVCACFLARTTPRTSVVKFLRTVAWWILCSVIGVYGSRASVIFITAPRSELDVCPLPCFLFSYLLSH